MGLFADLDAELQKDLLDFVREREEQPWPRKFGDSLLTDVIKDIIKGPCSITGWARKGNKCWMELTWNFDKTPEAVKEPEQEKAAEAVKTTPEPEKKSFSNEELKKVLEEAVQAEGKQELLDRVKAHCKEHCAWLKNDKAVSEYALECLSSKAYEAWGMEE